MREREIGWLVDWLAGWLGWCKFLGYVSLFGSGELGGVRRGGEEEEEGMYVGSIG